MDSRLNQIIALLDDARTLVADICDESPPFRMHVGLDGVRTSLDDARHHMNEAIRRAQNVKADAE